MTNWRCFRAGIVKFSKAQSTPPKDIQLGVPRKIQHNVQEFRVSACDLTVPGRISSLITIAKRITFYG